MIHHGDLFDVLPTLLADSIDAGVMDPPYGIGFMGKKWDTFAPAESIARKLDAQKDRFPADHPNPNLRNRTQTPAKSPSQIEYNRTLGGQREFQAWTERWAREVFRVLKPGAYLVVCGAPRSGHRMTSGIEDAGFEIRDVLSWLTGQGFPKSMDVSKAIDRELRQPREVSGSGPAVDRNALDFGGATGKAKNGLKADWTTSDPNTPEAARWQGWGTALKPAYEPIVLARKPLIGTVAANVLAHGTGAINIDACRIAVNDDDYARNASGDRGHSENRSRQMDFAMTAGKASDIGRWPANVAFDEVAAAMLDEQSGELVSGANQTRRSSDKFRDIFGEFKGQEECTPSRGLDVGGASRFYYVAKPSRAERDLGCADLPIRTSGDCTDREEGSAGITPYAGAGRSGGGRNFHPTVKPVELMRWLVRLVTPPGGTVLDPFTGSGTTGMACAYELRPFIGIEREAEYVEIATRRIAACAPLFSEAL